MSKYDELKRLAMAGDPASCENMDPELVIELIAENERLERAVKLRDDNLTMLRDDAESKDQRIKNHFETIDSLAAERDQLKAENGALRKDAERYRWLRDKSENLHGFYLSTPLWMTGVRFSKENVDSTIDASMSSGEQS